MPCQALHGWTFTGLVGAFLDLSIAFLLLCASFLAFLTSRFLGLFGLFLPCPCNGLFGNPQNRRNECFQRLLVDCPPQKISSVQSSIKSRFPFDSIGIESRLNSNPENKKGGQNEGHASEGESSCITSMGRRSDDVTSRGLVSQSGFVFGAMNSSNVKDGRFEFRGKRFTRHRSRSGLRRRRTGSFDNRKLSVPAALYKSYCEDAETQTPLVFSASFDNIRDKTKEGGEDRVDCKGDDSNDDKDSATSTRPDETFSNSFKSIESINEEKDAKKNALPEEGFQSNTPRDPDGNPKNTIRVLEQALEEEHAARAVLDLELEKERVAAATAADEAMAMISRLQEEKASIEMEAMQYHRMMEEKYSYDAEEMDILKEILVRREREKYYLEKENEAYRQIIFGNEHIGPDMFDMEAIKAEMLLSRDELPKNFSELPIRKVEGIHSGFTSSDDESTQAFQEKEMVVPGQNQHLGLGELERKSSASRFFPPPTPEPDDLQVKSIYQESDRVRDDSAIDDEFIVSKDAGRKKNEKPQKNRTSNTAKTNYKQSTPRGLPPIGRSRSMRSDSRRKSMSAFDAERFKIDNEISWLRERLRIVQEGRDKLNFSVGHEAREKIQLQILEDITSQLREIRQLTEPGKAARRASLPPLSSNVMSKKRRWRGGTLLVQKST